MYEWIITITFLAKVFKEQWDCASGSNKQSHYRQLGCAVRLCKNCTALNYIMTNKLTLMNWFVKGNLL